jgi:hypothetical protein
MKKLIITIVCVGLIVAASISYYVFRPAKKDFSSQKADYVVSAIAIASQYATDEKKCDSLYLDKIIEVEGKVVNVAKDSSSVNITLEGSETGGVLCAFNIIPQPVPSVGSIIKIKGKCTGFLMDVALKSCNLIK